MDPNDYLNGGGSASASFNVGTVVKGTIVGLEVVQQRDFKTKLPKTWPDGQPMMQLIVTLQTDERDPSIEDDDGKRRIFTDSKAKREAVQAAVKASGAKIVEGGTFAMKCTGEEPPTQPGLNARKLYVAQYQPPTNEAAANDLLGTGTPAAQPAAQAQPVEAATDLLGNGAAPATAASVL